MLPFYLKGLVIGFAIAAPVGPIGILCIQRSLHNGFKVGLMTGLGAALADGVYGIIAGFGLTAISSFLMSEQRWIRLIGGLFLIYLSFKLIFTPYKAPSTRGLPQEQSSTHAFITTFFLTLTNPATILSFIAVFAALGLGQAQTDYLQAIFLVLGIVGGSACWWLLLSSGVAFMLHHRLTDKNLRLINKFSGLIMLLFGIASII